MEIDLTLRLAKKVYGGDGGSYPAWSPSELPMLREGDIGAAQLSLEKDGLALPNYSDFARVAYVLQGNGVVGIVLPEKEEKVTYIVRGSGRVQVVGVHGKKVLETTVTTGNLFIVPRFFIVSKIADPEGFGMVFYHHHSQSNIHSFGWKCWCLEGVISSGA
ncbi:putative rmlC-like jelly roll protein [Rosa chinensis]|uniref:Putative rmlC-like jelly roll protein n=1 Tax=Rosa chinensis TaxID=74649 RepID=A0A2P6P3P7_ROSCH|nr:putative rmlC-like jelly roll protein [Rosa chinensis]